MSQFHATSHDLSKPADILLQAVVTAERRLTVIAASLPMHMVQDKILSGLSSAYSFIITLLQVESPQRDDRADLQRTDSVIKAARATKDFDDMNQGAHLVNPAVRTPPTRTRTRIHRLNRMDVCYLEPKEVIS
ncbi:hypothetical protein B0H14DRAFT_2570133 [Mycena olivaceomarginata]|nr:hypothetical protein B0H14DRAFT_2570133 [Mycena olivaceomarginata]